MKSSKSSLSRMTSEESLSITTTTFINPTNTTAVTNPTNATTESDTTTESGTNTQSELNTESGTTNTTTSTTQNDTNTESDKGDKDSSERGGKDSLEFHQIFHSLPQLNTKEIIKSHSHFFLKPVLGSILSPLKSFDESRVPLEWSAQYKMTVSVVKNVMQSVHSVDDPNPKYFQKVTEFAQPLPFKAILKPNCSFKVDQKVIEFMKCKDRVKGPWPSVADETNQVYGEWISARKGKVNQFRVVYQLHGGAYVSGSAQLYRRMAYFLSKAADAKCYSINYRLAPLYPYPCAVIDAVSGYIELLKKYKPENIIISGDSAGGGLALSTILIIRDMGLPKPAGGYLMSPWVDLTLSFPSFHDNHGLDVLPEIPIDSRMPNRLHYYAHDLDLKNPYVSPLYDQLHSLPPLFIQSGSVEKLIDEITFLCTQSIPSSTSLVYEIYKSHIHVFQQLRSVSNAPKIAMKRAGEWMKGHFECSNSERRKRRDAYLMDFFGNQVSVIPVRDLLVSEHT